MGYGQDQLRLTMYQYLIRLQNFTTPVINPCMLVNYTEVYNFQSRNYTLVGGGNSTACIAVIQQLLNLTAPCSQTPCSINGVYQSAVTGDFVGFSSFAFTYSTFFNTTQLLAGLTPSEMLTVGQNFCSLDWSVAVSLYPTQAPNFLKDYCYQSLYMSLLVQAYGVPLNERRIKIASNINNNDVAWALGAIVFEAILHFPVEVYVKESGYLGIASGFLDEKNNSYSLFAASKSTNEGPFAKEFKTLVLHHLEKQKISENDFAKVT